MTHYRKINMKDTPEDIYLDIQVGVGEPISESPNRTPFDIRMTSLQILRETRTCIGYGFEAAKDCVLQQIIPLESIAIVADPPLDDIDSVRDIAKQGAIVDHSGTRSRSTLSRANDFTPVPTFTGRPRSSLSASSRSCSNPK